MTSPRTGPERPAITKAWTADMRISFPGGKSLAANNHGKFQNMTTRNRGGTVTPTRETEPFGSFTVTLEGNIETFRETMTNGETTMIPNYFWTSGRTMPRGKRAIDSEMMTIPSGKMTVIPDRQTKTLREESLISEVDTDPLLDYVVPHMEAESKRSSSGPVI